MNQTIRRRSLRVTTPLLVAALLAAGCAKTPTMPPTPNEYRQHGLGVLEEMPADRRTVEVDLLYATDRKRVIDETGDPEYYDERRSDSLAIGHVAVKLGEDLSWDGLLDAARDPRAKKVPLAITDVEELVRFPSSIAIPVRVDGTLVDDPEVIEARRVAREHLHSIIRERLATSDRKEAFVYIHGVGNSFEDPMYRMAQLWHFLGRPGVPFVYTWPAIKGGGPLRGYTYARESSEFTVYHMREFLLAVASCPEIERIHILAHSRGTGVTLSVLRDLRLIYLTDAAAARRDVKLGNIILAAPDIDMQVAQQRFRPDQVYEIFERMTMYATPEDKALGIAEFLFSSLTRLGAATSEDMSDEQIEALRDDRIGADVVEVEVEKKGAHGHTYWIDNPSVFSDVILILRDDRDPGRANGRPLIRADSGMWIIRDGYPYDGDHAMDVKDE
jgi:esterase/lipase superfamily enzyme